jgi:hypothetical protein
MPSGELLKNRVHASLLAPPELAVLIVVSLEPPSNVPEKEGQQSD